MLMSMKSTPSGWSFTPASWRSRTSAFVNFSTCIVDAAPAAPLIHANECRTLAGGIQGECALMWMPMSPCSYRIGSWPSISIAYRRPGFSRFHPGVSVEVTYRTFSSYISSIAPRPWRCIASRARARRNARTASQLIPRFHSRFA